MNKEIEIIDLALYLKKHNVLIFADFHMGFEESLQKQGISLPRLQFKKTISRLKKIFEKVKPEIIVVNGDLKHEFGSISNQEWNDTLKLFDFLQNHCKKIILIKGNHDKILEPIASKRNLEVKDSVKFEDIQIIHGDKIPLNLSKTVIIGHEHPAVTASDNISSEKFKCWLKGKFQGKDLIVQPSFNLVTTGTDVLREKLLSPFLQQDLSNFEVWIVSDEVLYFGKLKNLAFP